MHYNATPGPSSLPRLMTPGLLDRSQTKRIRRHPDSDISFATYDYYTARSDATPDFEQLSLKEELYRSARVVIETLPSGASTWRFVPRARKADGVPDEGIWPRPVEICGNFYECSQEQWDCYKLDPLYHCFVRVPPMCPIISRRVDQPKEDIIPSPKKTRRRASPPPSPRARKKTVSFEIESEDEHEEVEDMIVDDEYPHSKTAGPGSSPKTRAGHREKVETDRGKRRSKTAQRTEQLSRENTSPETFTFSFDATPNGRSKSAPARPASSKRKVDFLFDSLRTNNNPDDDDTRPMDESSRNTATYVPLKKAKRTRTASPSQVKKILREKKAARREPRMEQRKHNLEAWRMAREEERLRDSFVVPSDVEMPDAPISASQCSVDMNSPSPERQDEPELDYSTEKTPVPDDLADNCDPQAAHEAAIEASRRKMAELEKDRVIWEGAAARRREQERMEEAVLKREAAARRQAMEAERQEQARQAEEERILREQSAQPQPTSEKILAETQRREKIISLHREWYSNAWADDRAFQRYFTLTIAFVKTTFKPGEASMTALDVPWPMLTQQFTLEEVTTEEVSNFFDALRRRSSADDFRTLVKKSSLRFHPDHWKNRLSSVTDEEERQAIFEGELVV
ncbi:hypothetical protein C0991_005264 [Blastosporella zonata]|nr:hypothetical protein C0991_005264 [Blastosporella zonata]